MQMLESDHWLAPQKIAGSTSAGLLAMDRL
jgi:hypothetical protein